MTDVQRRSTYFAKFGDPLTYSNYPPNPLLNMTRRILPPNNRKGFTSSEYDEFLDYLYTLGIKMRTIHYYGQILITELEVHGGHESAIGAFFGMVNNYDELHSDDEHSILKFGGQRSTHFSHTTMLPDAQWIPVHGLTPSLVLEIGNSQTIGMLLTKVNIILNESKNSRYIVVVKLWRDPVPARVAMVVMVWRKSEDIVAPAEYEATHFISFGNKAPTAAQLAGFPMVPDPHGAWLPELQGVVEDEAFSVPCNSDNIDHPMFNIQLHAQSLFSLPNDQGPQPHLIQALPPLVFHLARIRWKILEMIVDDILVKMYHLSDEEVQEIVDHQETQISYPSLYMFALQQIALNAH